MKPVALFLSIALATASFAQVPEPTPEPAPAPTTEPAPPPPPAKEKSSIKDKLFVGGGIGLSFGTVDYVSISPLVGFHLAPRFDLAIQPFYSYTKDSRYSPEFSASNYGADLIGRVRIVQNFFAEARVEWISYEYLDSLNQTSRQSDTYPFAGLGYTIGAGRAGITFSALYNFGYDSNVGYGAYGPYDSPWSYQVGVSVGF